MATLVFGFVSTMALIVALDTRFAIEKHQKLNDALATFCVALDPSRLDKESEAYRLYTRCDYLWGEVQKTTLFDKKSFASLVETNWEKIILELENEELLHLSNMLKILYGKRTPLKVLRESGRE